MMPFLMDSSCVREDLLAYREHKAANIEISHCMGVFTMSLS